MLNGPGAIQTSQTEIEIIDRRGKILAALSGSKGTVAEGILRVVHQRLICGP